MNCLEQPCARRVGYNYPEPIMTYVAAYDRSMVSRRTNRKTPVQVAKALWEFFSRFPSRKNLDKIYITDVEDYRKIRLLQVSESVVKLELDYLRAFYNFVNREFALDFANPVPRGFIRRSRHLNPPDPPA